MKSISILVLRLFGWRLSGGYPDIDKSVMIIAPHTSMWDFVIGRLAIWGNGVEGRFLIKKEMFVFPLSILLKALGALPVDRGAGIHSFGAASTAIRETPRIALIITPEGTRKKVSQWKRGFHTIALRNGIPIVMGCLDYSEKVAYIGPVVYPTPDFDADMLQIEAWYRGRKGKHPERFNLL